MKAKNLQAPILLIVGITIGITVAFLAIHIVNTDGSSPKTTHLSAPEENKASPQPQPAAQDTSATAGLEAASSAMPSTTPAQALYSPAPQGAAGLAPYATPIPEAGSTTQVIEFETTASGYPVIGSGQIKAVDALESNPYWTMGNNGLIGNPCVDPPSSHGRAYSRGQ